MDFRTLTFGLSTEQLSLLLSLHPSTIRRYRSTNQAPEYILKLLAVYHAGRLPTGCESWANFQMNGSYLIDPDGNRYTASDITSLHWLRQLSKELEKMRQAPAQFLLF